MTTQANDRTADAAPEVGRTASQAFAHHFGEILKMAATINDCNWGKDCREANWSDVGSLAHAREKMAEALYALGAITEEQAAEHGATV